MILLIDCFCDKAVLMSESGEIKTAYKDNLIDMVKHNKIKVDNIYLNSSGTKLISFSGSLDRLEHMRKVVTVLKRVNNLYTCYIVARDSNRVGIETYNEETLRRLIKNDLVFNAFLRENSIVIKGEIFTKFKSTGLIGKVEQVEKQQKGKKSYVGTIQFSDIQRIDEELTPTTFEIQCDNSNVLSKLANILKSEYKQEFNLSEADDCSVFDSLKHNISCYIAFANKYCLKIEFKISIYDIDELMEYAEDMEWTVEKFKSFMNKYHEYSFELDDNVKEILN